MHPQKIQKREKKAKLKIKRKRKRVSFFFSGGGFKKKIGNMFKRHFDHPKIFFAVIEGGIGIG